MNNKEKLALKLKKRGLTTQEIEKRLGHEFIFNKDYFDNKYISATLWR